MKQAPVVYICSLEHVYFYLVEKWRVYAVTKLLQIMLYPTERKKVLKEDDFFYCNLTALSDMKHNMYAFRSNNFTI